MKTKIILLTIFMLFVGIGYLFPQESAFAACTQLPNKGNVSLGTDVCTIANTVYSGIDAVSGDNNTAILTLNNGGGSITINSGGHLFVGSVVISAGSISIQAGGEMKTNAPLWITDADGDGYPASTTVDDGSIRTNKIRLGSVTSLTLDCSDSVYNVANTCCIAAGGACTQDSDCCASAQYCGTDADNDGVFSQAAGHTGTCTASNKAYTDCNDSGTNAAQVSISATCYLDSDNDNYGSSTSYTCMNNATCLSATWGSIGTGTASNTNFSNVSTDCADGSANAYPGSTYYGTVGVPGYSGGGGYDYDCDGNSNDTSETSDNWSCNNPCLGCSADYSMSPGWQSGAPGCGQTANRVNAAEPYLDGTCYTVASCNTITMVSGVTMGCK